MPDQPQVIEMFGGGNDLPIFSGTAQKVIVKEFKPQEQVRQPSMFAAVTCSVCFGTREITSVGKRGKKKVIACMYCSDV